MPFLSEEIWQNIKNRKTDDSLIVASYPSEISFDNKIIADFEKTKEIITSIRNFRSEKGISPKEPVDLILKSEDNLENAATIKKLANISELSHKENTDTPAYNFLVGKNEFAIPFSQTINAEEEKIKIQKEISYLQGFLKSINAKLSNEKFVNGAPEKVVATEKKKQTDALEKIAILEDNLKKL
jgi:valyl-tRNA synthetase